MSFKRNTERWATRRKRHQAKPRLKAVIVVGPPLPRTERVSTATRGFASLRLQGPADRKQPAPGASGKQLVSGVSASALHSEAAAVPEPDVCARVEERVCGVRWGRGCGRHGRSQRRNLAGTFLQSPGGVGYRPRSSRPAVATRGGIDEGSDRAFCTLRWSFFSLVLCDPCLSLPPSAGFVLFPGPGVSRRVLGVGSGGGGGGWVLRESCRDL